MFAWVEAMPPLMFLVNFTAALGMLPLGGTPTMPTALPGLVTFSAVVSDSSLAHPPQWSSARRRPRRRPRRNPVALATSTVCTVLARWPQGLGRLRLVWSMAPHC